MQAFNVISSPESSKDSAPGDVCGPGNEVWVYEEKLYLSGNSKSVDQVEM
jgi:hypothetical protein